MNVPIDTCMSSSLRLSSDIGGTFTDIALEQGSSRWSCKVPTTPGAPEEGVLEGMRQVLEMAQKKFADLDAFIHGTTLPTNAVIERQGARTALVTTEGFRDVLEIGNEGRYDQYEMALVRPRPLVERPLRLTLAERIDARGQVIKQLEEGQLQRLVGQLRAQRVESVAVVFLHAYRNPAHEKYVERYLSAELPEVNVSLSSEICPEIREYERTSTTVLNAYIQPVIAGYLRRLESRMKEQGFQGEPLIMTSGGTLTSFTQARRFPVRLIESGPAGGALFAAHAAARVGERHVIAFDMGGTTAKLCLISDSSPEKSRLFEADRAARFMKGSGLPVRVPVIDLVEIGAGGGSIASVDALRRVRAGPRSASSVPGPACFGRGGTQPTVTDADLTLGLIDADRFAAGSMKLNVELAHRALAEGVGRPLGISPVDAAHAVYETVCESMASAARVHAVEKGASIGRYSMIASGGAAPLHAARVAEKVGISRIIVPSDAGVGSAVGFLRAPVGFESVRTLQVRLEQFDPQLAAQITSEMRESAMAQVRAYAGNADLDETCLALMRYVGQGYEVSIDVTQAIRDGLDGVALRELFEAAYVRLFGRTIPRAAIEIISWSVEVTTRVTRPPSVDIPSRIPAPKPGFWSRIYHEGEASVVEVPCFQRSDLPIGSFLSGPALILESQTTTYVSGNFDAHIDGAESIVMERKGRNEAQP